MSSQENYLASGTNGRMELTSNQDANPEDFDVPSVKDLASRFGNTVVKPQLKPKPAHGPVASRTRSKSESGSKKPKSILKSKKAKSNNNARPRKSVIFAKDIDFSELAAGYESAGELLTFKSKGHSNDRAYYSDDEEPMSKQPVTPVSFPDNDLDLEDTEGSSNSDDYPIPREELACQLCRKREMEPGKAYCTKCSFYMSRLA